jgi:hypothetical protein
MAQFCTKCGSPMTEGAQFCTACGASSGPPLANSAPVPFTPVNAPVMTPGYPQIPVAPKPAGNPVLKIILIVLLVLVFLGALMAGGCVYFYYRAKQRIAQIQKQVNTSFPAPNTTPGVRPTFPGQAIPQDSDANIDIASLQYPGATAKEGASLAMGGIRVQQYVTSDSFEKVVSFYKDKLGPRVRIEQTDSQAVLQVGNSNDLLNITVNRDVASGQTKFSIMRMGGK